jgi:hypothetical protein
MKRKYENKIQGDRIQASRKIQGARCKGQERYKAQDTRSRKK